MVVSAQESTIKCIEYARAYARKIVQFPNFPSIYLKFSSLHTLRIAIIITYKKNPSDNNVVWMKFDSAVHKHCD